MSDAGPRAVATHSACRHPPPQGGRRKGARDEGCANGLHASFVELAAGRDEQRVKSRSAKNDAGRFARRQWEDATRAAVAVEHRHTQSRCDIGMTGSVHAYTPSTAIVGPVGHMGPEEPLLRLGCAIGPDAIAVAPMGAALHDGQPQSIWRERDAAWIFRPSSSSVFVPSRVTSQTLPACESVA